MTSPVNIGCDPAESSRTVRIVHISDTHLQHDLLLDKIPAGDILIHSGDFSKIAWPRYIFRHSDYLREIEEIKAFFSKLPHKYKIFVAGNHEINFERENLRGTVKRFEDTLIYLQDSFVVIEGIKIYGSPWTGLRHNSHARGFTVPYSRLRKKWKHIPQDTDILITHSPPHGIFDLGLARRITSCSAQGDACQFCDDDHVDCSHFGCAELADVVLNNVKPNAHLFGHAHASNGLLIKDKVVFSNAAMACLPEAKVIDFHLPEIAPSHTNTIPQSTKNARTVRIVHVSDTHMSHDSFSSMPNGDILIHSGDFLDYDGIQKFQDCLKIINNFFRKMPHQYKIFVAGNHELCFRGKTKQEIRDGIPNVIYLQDDFVTIYGLKIYGAPWNTDRGSVANAFVKNDLEIQKSWRQIPDDVDILVTHSPPHKVLDNIGSMGCRFLRDEIFKRIRPMAHLFGHAHMNKARDIDGIHFSNAACAFDYVPRVIEVTVDASKADVTQTSPSSL